MTQVLRPNRFTGVRWPKRCPRCNQVTFGLDECCRSVLDVVTRPHVMKIVTNQPDGSRVTEVVMTEGVRAQDGAA